MDRQADSLRRITPFLAVVLALVWNANAVAAETDLDGRLRQASADYAETVREATQIGALIGTFAGGAIGAMSGHNAGSAVGGALIGALAGGVLGNIGGHAIAEKKAGYAQQEDDLDARIARARAGNSKLAALVSVANRLVETRRAELRRLSANPDPAARSRLKTQLSSEVATLDGSLAKAKETRDTLKDNVANYRSAALAREASRTDGQISSLKSQRDALNTMYEGL